MSTSTNYNYPYQLGDIITFGLNNQNIVQTYTIPNYQGRHLSLMVQDSFYVQITPPGFNAYFSQTISNGKITPFDFPPGTVLSNPNSQMQAQLIWADSPVSVF